MGDVLRSPFKNGFWQWDEVSNELLFVSRDSPRAPSLTTINTAQKQQPAPNEIKFRETVDTLEQIRFRRHRQRKCKPKEPRVITIQDVKDVALFLASMKDISSEFIKYFHIPTMDRFLRALIVYFQYYTQVWERLLVRREESKRKLSQASAAATEIRIRDDLSDLRVMVAREYCTILYGGADAKKFHHMNNKNNDSLSDKDRRLFETLISMVVRVVWIALQRRNLSLIELEVNRLLRTDIFNITMHRGLRGGADLYKTAAEEHILTGVSNTEERKLLHRSPIAKELIIGIHDYRMLIIGTRDYMPKTERLEYLEIAIAAPEELLLENGVTVGLLGISRDDYDAMLMTKIHPKRKSVFVEQVLPEFQLPLKDDERDVEMQKRLSTAPPTYPETHQKTRSRIEQCKMWLKVIEKAAEGRELSILDLSISQSHALLLSSKSSISILIHRDSKI